MKSRNTNLKDSKARQAKSALTTSQSEEILRSVFKATPIGLCVIKNRTFVNVNRWYEKLGYSGSEIIGHSPRMFYETDEEYQRVGKELFTDLFERGIASVQTIHKTKDGKIRDVILTAVPLQSDDALSAMSVVMVEDITDRKNTEEALRESVEQFKTVFESASIGITQSDPSTRRFLAVNPKMCELTGYTAAEMLLLGITDITHSEDQERDWTAYQNIISGRSNAERYEKRYIRKDGSIIWVNLNMTAIHNASGQLARMMAIVEDITERKRAEEELKFRNLILATQQEVSLDGILVVDEKGHIISYNQRFVDLWGIPTDVVESRSDERALQSVLRRLVNPEEFLTRVQYLYEHRDERSHEEVDIIGGITFERYSAPMLGPSGEYYGRVWYFRDITGRIKAEAAHRESERRLSDIIEFLPDATLVIDKDGKVISWNKAMEQMTGVQAADMLGKGNYEYTLPFYGERRPILIDLVLKPQKETEAKYVRTERKDTVLYGEAYMPALKGGEVYLFGTASALLDSTGNVVGAIESIRDITERRKSEEMLRQSEEKFTNVFMTAPDCIAITRLADGRNIEVNLGFEEITGWKRSEVVGLTSLEINFWVNPPDRDFMVQELKAGRNIRNQEFQFRRKDGSIRYGMYSARPIQVANEECLIFILHDNTDKKQLMEERLKLEEHLNRTAKMEAIGTLAGGIAHDFNNILAAMMGFAEMIKLKTTDQTIAPYLEQILKACDRSRDLVKQILTFSRRVDQEKRPVSIVPIIKEALKLIRSSIPSTVEIRQEYNIRQDTVLADPTQIHQVLMNLCTNAVHAMREREGILKVSLSQKEISFSDHMYRPELPEGTYLLLTVTDTGKGIDPSIKDKIFDPFFTTKELGEGTGLGLSVVYGIVKDCGGAISVDSEPGKGTVFTIHLPLIVMDEMVSVKQTSNIPKGKGSILYVDDEEPIATLGHDLLTTLGYDVTVRFSSLDALEAFRANPQRFDLVITDMTMPHMTGAVLSRELLKVRPGLPIILTTGFSEMINEEDAKKIGVREFLMKPVSLDNLAQAVKKLMAEKQTIASR